MTRWSTGSYLEAQDFWRISGIERTVYLSAETPDALRDFEVVSTLDDSYRTGLFTLKMFLAGDRGGRGRATNCSIPRAAPSPRDGSRQRAKPCSVPRYPTQRTGRPKRPTATGS